MPRWRKERKRKFFFDPRSRLVQIQDASFALHRDAEVLRQKQKVQVSHTNAHGMASIYRCGPLTEKGRRTSGGGSGTAEEEMTQALCRRRNGRVSRLPWQVRCRGGVGRREATEAGRAPRGRIGWARLGRVLRDQTNST